MPACGHVHRYRGRTTYNDRHRHGFDDFTGCRVSVGRGRHVHRYENRTTMNDGHRHRMDDTTGINYRVAGGHRHRSNTRTSYNDGHRHRARFVTRKPRYQD